MRQHSYELAPYAGRQYALSVRVEPDYDDVQDFAVVVYYSTSKGENKPIARIDTDHGGPHFDRLFLEQPDKKFFDIDWYDAEEKLANNWRDYARQYEKNHG